jgi:non-specific serine/threonine protein kinase
MAGRALLVDQAVAEALTVQPPPAGKQSVRLTRREQQVAHLIAEGLTNRQIAATLGIAERTADTHVARLLAKLGVASRAEVASRVDDRLAMPSPHPGTTHT